jgi:hypothetical protein
VYVLVLRLLGVEEITLLTRRLRGRGRGGRTT